MTLSFLELLSELKSNLYILQEFNHALSDKCMIRCKMNDAGTPGDCLYCNLLLHQQDINIDTLTESKCSKYIIVLEMWLLCSDING